ncbi:acyltransferase [Spirosoma sp. KUDC1026]|uniref:acyltransferase n=1 Tax=Spirosoma sp. KUDC1026 TaxID=2745947 RepID=UPI00159B96F6|nr:acyltransferase [Spirosoma sp. KUDC1026]QKZ15435.1 acyltransferase [Spirosoma sp. KUDC1026]
MASFSYLWQNRARFSYKSILFYRAWAKRLLLLWDLKKRNSIRKRLIKQGAKIHKTAEIESTKIYGKKNKLNIGSFTYVGDVHIALHDNIVIGNNVCINNGVFLLSASHDILDPAWKHKKAPIKIGDYVWIATNAIILPGVTIGNGAVIGAGAVVSKDIYDHEIAIGNPAKAIVKKRVKGLNYNPCEFLAANQAWLKG